LRKTALPSADVLTFDGVNAGAFDDEGLADSVTSTSARGDPALVLTRTSIVFDRDPAAVP
jgi:hypothetical protein